jgi:hypothetical protein
VDSDSFECTSYALDNVVSLMAHGHIICVCDVFGVVFVVVVFCGGLFVHCCVLFWCLQYVQLAYNTITSYKMKREHMQEN